MSSHRKTVTLVATSTEGSTKHNNTYLDGAFGDPAALVYDAMTRIKGSGVEFDTMVGRGFSGALVVPLLARAMSKHFAIVRKGEKCHSVNLLEGRLGSRWIFVDDLICSGDTFARTAEAVLSTKPGMVCVGAYIYGTGDGAPGWRGSYFNDATLMEQYCHAAFTS